ncbi:hypothetical protein RJT34_17453 [Clitoria ternatea]|uniref:NAC domain-containing protein n=1 Tax=Clitoria ternatea TaxID=43366 RepID=A0AAN9JC41_CLITE
MENILSILANMPVGFRFHPTDEELVNYYLRRKLLADDFPVLIIPEIDLCKVEPWDVRAKSVIKSDDPEWYFFSPVDHKYSNSRRFNRRTKHGYWKATGQDRKIKVRGTLIGTKKTLVFYEGRVPHGVRTNWVIHEYHDATFEQSQRTFVLCFLKNKFDAKSEGETEALMYDEGEPSTRTAPHHDNPATAEGDPAVVTFPAEMDILPAIIQAEECLSPLEQSPIGIEWGGSFLLNAYFGNEEPDAKTPFEITDEDNDFVNSILANEEFVINEERRHAFVNSSTLPKSLTRVYNESSDTDAEVVSAVHGNVVDTSSCDSTVDKALEINCIESSSAPSTQRRWKDQCHLGPSDNMSHRSVARRSQTLRKVSNNAVSHIEAEKRLLIVESEKDQKNAQNRSSRENTETRSRQSFNVDRKGSFIIMETPLSSQSLFPRSVYLFNIVIGILLLIMITWDVLLG